MSSEEELVINRNEDMEGPPLMFDGKLSGLTLVLPINDFECPQGHKWSGQGNALTIQLYGPEFEPAESDSLCPYCVIEWLNAMFPVAKVGGTSGTTDEEEDGGPGPETEGE